MKLEIEVSKQDSDQLDAIVYAHDEMKQFIDDIGSMANGGDIGWNQGMELGMNVGSLMDQWRRMEKALAIVNALRTAIESHGLGDTE